MLQTIVYPLGLFLLHILSCIFSFGSGDFHTQSLVSTDCYLPLLKKVIVHDILEEKKNSSGFLGKAKNGTQNVLSVSCM